MSNMLDNLFVTTIPFYFTKISNTYITSHIAILYLTFIDNELINIMYIIHYFSHTKLFDIYAQHMYLNYYYINA